MLDCSVKRDSGRISRVYNRVEVPKLSENGLEEAKEILVKRWNPDENDVAFHNVPTIISNIRNRTNRDDLREVLDIISPFAEQLEFGIDQPTLDFMKGNNFIGVARGNRFSLNVDAAKFETAEYIHEALVHEMFHNISLGEMRRNEDLRDEISNLRFRLADKFAEEIKNDSRIAYMFSNNDEFLTAAFTSAKFNELVNSKDQNFFERLIDVILEFLGVETNQAQRIRNIFLDNLPTPDTISFEVSEMAGMKNSRLYYSLRDHATLNSKFAPNAKDPESIPEIALAIYAFTKTDEFNDWYGNGERDSNGDPVFRDLVFTNGKGEQKDIDFNDIDFAMSHIGHLNSQSTINTSLLNFAINNQLSRISNSILSLNQELEKATNDKIINAILKKKQAIESLRRTLWKNKNILESNTLTLNTIAAMAEEHSKYVTRILSQDIVLPSELSSIEMLIEFWIKVGDTQSDEHILLVPGAELTVTELKQMALISATYRGFYKIMNTKNKEIIDEYAYGSARVAERNRGEVNQISSLLRGTGTVGNLFAQTTNKFIQDLDLKINLELSERLEQLSDILEKVSQEEIESLKEYDLKGRATGNIIANYKQDYLRDLGRVEEELRKDKKFDNTAHKDYQKHLRDNYFIVRTDLIKEMLVLADDIARNNRQGLTINANSLQEKLNSVLAEYAQAIQEMKDGTNYTDAEVDQIYDRAVKKVREDMKSYLYDKEMIMEDHAGNTQEIRKKLFQLERRMDVGSSWAFANYAYGKSKSVTKKGDQSGWLVPTGFRHITPKDKKYQNDFDSIRGNENLYNLWKFIIDLNAEVALYLPPNKLKNFSQNFMPMIAKHTLSNMKDGKEFLAKFGDQFTTLLTRDARDGQGVNVITGRKDPILTFNTLRPTAEDIAKVGTIINAERVANGQDILDEDELNRAAHEHYANNASWDLSKVMQLYIYQAVSYKYKSVSEDVARSFLRMAQSESQIKTNPETLVKQRKEDSQRLDEMIVDQILEGFYGINLSKDFGKAEKDRRLFGISLTTRQTKEQKDLDERIDALLNNPEIKNSPLDKFLNDIKKENKEYVMASGLINAVLRWGHLRAMGWNVFSSISTILFGTMVNWIEGNRLFSIQGINRGTAVVTSGILSQFRRNDTSEAAKLRAISKRVNFVQQTMNELTRQYRKSVTDKKVLENLKPMALQNGAEAIVQLPILYAALWDKKVKVDGKEIRMIDGFDSNGKWKHGDLPLEEFSTAILSAKIARDKVHGNYDQLQNIKISKWALGRMATQYRKWLPEGVASRFENEHDQLGLQKKVKGRWRSYATLFEKPVEGSEYTRMDIATAALKDLIRTAIPMMQAKSLQELGEKGYSQVDVENMVSNMREFYLFLVVSLVGMMLRGWLDDEDDEKTKGNLMLAVNQLTRIETDFLVYMNPGEFEKLNKNFLPIVSVFKETLDLFPALYNAANGDDKIKGGVFSGDSRLLRDILQAFPGGAQAYRIRSASSQLFDK